LIRIGAKTIKAMIAPMITIPSVEPISELSFAGGVGVVCWRVAPESSGKGKTGAGDVTAALRIARVKLRRIVMAGRVSFFIDCISITCEIFIPILSFICT
jgi:hypothetical protein